MSGPWPLEPLGTVLTPVRRSEAIDPERRYRILGARLYAAGLFVKEEKLGAEIAAATAFRVEAGDFVYNRLFAWKGSFALAEQKDHGGYVSNEFPCFFIDSKRLFPPYLRYYFSRAIAWEEALGLSTGGTPISRNRLKEALFLAMRIPLPPLAEQRRIVGRIDAVAGRIAEAKRLNEESVSATNALFSAVAGSRFASLAGQTSVANLGDLTTLITDGPHVTPNYVPEGVPFVTVKNMVSGRLDFRDLQYITPEDHAVFRARCKVERGDVLYSKDGATRGRPCFVDTDHEFSIFVSVALIKPKRDLLDGRYLCHLLASRWIKDRMRSRSRGDMIPHIVLREIRAFPVPLLPIPVQRAIAAELDEVKAASQALRGFQSEIAAELDALLPAVLADAFAGRL